jgi:LacI family transcriptional regulator
LGKTPTVRDVAARAGVSVADAIPGHSGRRQNITQHMFGGNDLESLRSAIENELDRAVRTTAIFADTNICALASIKAARGLGLDIPEDVSIVGFDWMLALRPYLTTVAQPIEDFAFVSGGYLMRRMSGEALDVKRVELPRSLKVWESTGPARPRFRAVAEVHR